MLDGADGRDAIIANITSVDESETYLTLHNPASTSNYESDVVWINLDYCNNLLAGNFYLFINFYFNHV